MMVVAAAAAALIAMASREHDPFLGLSPTLVLLIIRLPNQAIASTLVLQTFTTIITTQTNSARCPLRPLQGSSAVHVVMHAGVDSRTPC
jgi:hypothetical protein